MYNMDNVYGTLKYIGEHYTRKLGGLSARFWNVYGPESVSEKSHVITDILHKFETKGYIDLMTDGEEERQFLHTDDCAKCLMTVMDKYDEISENVESVDITSFESIKIKEVAKCICDDIRPSEKKMNTHDRTNEPRPFILDYWKPVISLEEGIASLQRFRGECTSSTTQWLQFRWVGHWYRFCVVRSIKFFGNFYDNFTIYTTLTVETFPRPHNLLTHLLYGDFYEFSYRM